MVVGGLFITARTGGEEASQCRYSYPGLTGSASTRKVGELLEKDKGVKNLWLSERCTEEGGAPTSDSTPACLSVTLPPDAQVLRMALSDFEVPDNATTFMCTYFKLPTDRKYHIYNAKHVSGRMMVWRRCFCL